jgi:hypothetical protein
MATMANRPCKPDADTKRLWQMLMPGVAMPSCGTAQDDASDDTDKAVNTPASESAKNGTPSGGSRP